MQGNRILVFPLGGQTWRLDWLGDVSYRRQLRYTQPFIRVALSKVLFDTGGDWSYPIAFESSPEQVHASVPVSLLAGLRIGTIWQDGLMVADPGYASETFSFAASKGTTTLIKAGVKNDEQTFLLPFDAHPYHRVHTHSYCLQISVSDETKLVIPVPELIRFYFGSSSTFLGRLFQGPFDETSFWTRVEIDKTKAATVELAKGIAGASAADVARIAFDPAALHAAKLISNSLVAPTSPDGRTYPKAVLPFFGNTDLAVKGIWLQTAGRRTFLAFQIRSCTHRFPFRSLHYTMSKRRSEWNADSSKEDASETADTILRSRYSRAAGSLVGDAPDARKSAKEWRISSGSRFPDLDRKSVARVDPVAPIRVIITDTGELAAGVSVGDGEGSTGVRPIDLVAAQNVPIPRGHPLEHSVLAEYVDCLIQTLLKEGKSVWFVPLDARQRFPQFSVLPEILNEAGDVHPLSYIEEGGKTRPRYATVLRVRNWWPNGDEAWVVPEAENGEYPDGCVPIIVGIDHGEAIDAQWVALRTAGASWESRRNRES